MPASPITAIIVGAGHRARAYAAYARQRPEELKIVGVADPMPLRREQVARDFGLSPDQCFSNAEALAARGRIADAVINGTMDAQHVPTSLPLLETGYDLLLEKPFATSIAQICQLRDTAARHGRRVMICHVLRYTPFYYAIRERVAAGEVGEILNIQAVEHVSYHHSVVGFVRGKWNSESRCGSGMLLSKSCHDLDIIMWMFSGVAPIRVASFGSLQFFRRDKAPPNAGEYCLLDCPIETNCDYSARKQYLDHPQRWGFYVWANLQHIEHPTLEQKTEYLKRTDHNWGRCVWKCDNDVTDHQSVSIEFESGATATLNVIGAASKPMRSLHILGTKGEIQGVFEESRFVIRHIDARPSHETSEQIVDLKEMGDTSGAWGGHGGGDLRLVTDFVARVRGEPPSLACTALEDSIHGHLAGFLAERSRKERRVVEMREAGNSMPNGLDRSSQRGR